MSEKIFTEFSFVDNMRLASLLTFITVYTVRASYSLECDQNQNGQSMSFFKTNGDLSLTGKLDNKNNVNRYFTILIRFRFLWRLRWKMFGPDANGYSFDGNGSHRGADTQFNSLYSWNHFGYVEKYTTLVDINHRIRLSSFCKNLLNIH